MSATSEEQEQAPKAFISALDAILKRLKDPSLHLFSLGQAFQRKDVMQLRRACRTLRVTHPPIRTRKVRLADGLYAQTILVHDVDDPLDYTGFPARLPVVKSDAAGRLIKALARNKKAAVAHLKEWRARAAAMAPPPGAVQPARDDDGGNVFRREGEHWHIRYEGVDLPPVNDCVGLFYISCLIANRMTTKWRRGLSSGDLVRARQQRRPPYDDPKRMAALRAALRAATLQDEDEDEHDDEEPVLSSDGLSGSPMLEPSPLSEPGKPDGEVKAILAPYNNRLRSIGKELAEAKADRDFGRLTELEKEEANIKTYLEKSLTPDRKIRLMGQLADRPRHAVSKAIARALTRIKEAEKDRDADAPAWRHLKNSITTGYTCHYNPPQRIPWQLR